MKRLTRPVVHDGSPNGTNGKKEKFSSDTSEIRRRRNVPKWFTKVEGVGIFQRSRRTIAQEKKNKYLFEREGRLTGTGPGLK